MMDNPTGAPVPARWTQYGGRPDPVGAELPFRTLDVALRRRDSPQGERNHQRGRQCTHAFPICFRFASTYSDAAPRAQRCWDHGGFVAGSQHAPMGGHFSVSTGRRRCRASRGIGVRAPATAGSGCGHAVAPLPAFEILGDSVSQPAASVMVSSVALAGKPRACQSERARSAADAGVSGSAVGKRSLPSRPLHSGLARPFQLRRPGGLIVERVECDFAAVALLVMPARDS